MKKESPLKADAKSDEKINEQFSNASKMNTTAFSAMSIGDMHKYEKAFTLFNELPGIYETVGSTSNNLYSGDEFEETQVIEK